MTVAVPTHTHTPMPTPTPVPTATPTPFDIKKANCQHEDLPQETFEFIGSEGPHSWEPWGVREWYRTEWSDSESRIRCITLVFHTIEDARRSLNYSTAVQRQWGEAGLLEHHQVVVPAIGEDTLAIEIEVGQKIVVQGEEVPLEEYVATVVTFRYANIVATVEYGWETGSNPLTVRYIVDAFFNSSPDRTAKIARLIEQRLLAELARVDR